MFLEKWPTIQRFSMAMPGNIKMQSFSLSADKITLICLNDLLSLFYFVTSVALFLKKKKEEREQTNKQINLAFCLPFQTPVLKTFGLTVSARPCCAQRSRNISSAHLGRNESRYRAVISVAF